MTTSPDLSSALSPHASGCSLSLTVVPRAARTSLNVQPDGSLRARVAAPPVDGAANAALLKYLSQILDIPRSRLSIDAGASGRRKRIVVAGLSPEEILQRLGEALAR